jgi:hypothetical protein
MIKVLQSRFFDVLKISRGVRILEKILYTVYRGRAKTMRKNAFLFLFNIYIIFSHVLSYLNTIYGKRQYTHHLLCFYQDIPVTTNGDECLSVPFGTTFIWLDHHSKCIVSPLTRALYRYRQRSV